MRKYKAIFFDLDGTLLPMDMSEFMKGYLIQLCKYLSSRGYDNTRELVKVVLDSTYQESVAHIGITNDKVFWQCFTQATRIKRDEFEDVMLDFYDGPYNFVGFGLPEAKLSIRVLDIFKDKGYPLYLVTMPLFPVQAICNRMAWVGIDAERFELITSYDICHAAKPSLDFYRECIEFARVEPESILMVGNNTTEDLAAMQLGCDAYLVTDHLLDPDGVDYSSVKHGSMTDFIKFAESLPCLQASN